MTVSPVRKLYHSLLPSAWREKLWHWRHDRLARARADLAVRRSVKCNVCQGREIVPFHNSRVRLIPFNFYQCKDCDFIFVHPAPDPVTYYAEIDMPDFGEGEILWNTHYLETINKYSTGKGKLLEVGFGNGSFLTLANQHGWEVHGLDLSVPLVRHATEDLKLPNVSHGRIEDVNYPGDYFDVICAFNFIEHVADPRGTLRAIRRLLRPNGLVVLLCPNISGVYHTLMGEIFPESDPLNLTWIPPDHIGYFNKKNLKLLMESAGFSVIGDESHRTPSLWRQHESTIGPEVTNRKLDQLRAEIKASDPADDSTRVLVYGDRIKNLVLEKMTWAMVSDMMEIEPLLGAENAILFVGLKNEQDG